MRKLISFLTYLILQLVSDGFGLPDLPEPESHECHDRNLQRGRVPWIGEILGGQTTVLCLEGKRRIQNGTD